MKALLILAQLTALIYLPAIMMPCEVRAQELAVKTNLFYAATTTPNLGLESRLSNQWTLGLDVGLNPFSYSENKKLKHLLVSPQARYWFGESFVDHFVGFNLAYIHYNVGNIDFPLGLYSGVKNERRQGDAVAIGASWGHSWIFSPHWGVEVEAGLDLGYMWYKGYDPPRCGTYRGKGDGLLLMPRIALNIVYHVKTRK